MDKKEIIEPEKGFNLKVFELETNIMDMVIQSGFPATVQNFIIQNVANKISLATSNIIEKERLSYIQQYKEYGMNKDNKQE